MFVYSKFWILFATFLGLMVYVSTRREGVGVVGTLFWCLRDCVVRVAI